jgi:hypothetical protein
MACDPLSRLTTHYDLRLIITTFYSLSSYDLRFDTASSYRFCRIVTFMINVTHLDLYIVPAPSFIVDIVFIL